MKGIAVLILSPCSRAKPQKLKVFATKHVKSVNPTCVNKDDMGIEGLMIK